MDLITVVIVTYNQDLKKLSACLRSIEEHTIIDNDIKIVIIVNDSKECVPIVQEIVNQFRLNIEVVHYVGIGNWTQNTDWTSQQYLKLAICNKITTPWYLILDSDDFICKHISKDHLIVDGRAVHRTAYLTKDGKRSVELQKQLEWAFDKWYKNEPYTIPTSNWSDATPFIMHTATVQQMFTYIDETCFLSSIEFYLYYAYIHYCKLDNILYNNKFGLGSIFHKTI